MDYFIYTTLGKMTLSLPEGKRETDRGERYMICPICSSSRKPEHRNEEKLAVNIREMKWRCNHCQEGGLLHTNKELSDRIKPLNYLPSQKRLTERIYTWFLRRGITKGTVDYFRLKRAYKKILQIHTKDPNDPNRGKWIMKDCIAFPIIESGRLINIQYRDSNKNFSMEPGAEKVCFNIDAVRKKPARIIITEGYIDCMSYHEAGLIEVVSVPNGTTITVREKEVFASTGKMMVERSLNLSFIDLHIDYFQNAKEIILATDDDPAGIKLREELARRFGKDKCRYTQYSRWKTKDGKPCKDANDVLIHCGKEELRRTVEEAMFFPVKSITSIDEVWQEMENDFNSPVVKGLPLGFKELANHLTIHSGHSIAINGYPGSGKTSFILYLLTLMAVSYGWKSICYTPENYPVKLVYDHLIEIYMGKSSKRTSSNRMSEMQYREGKEFVKNHIWLISDEDMESMDDGYSVNRILKIFENAVRRHGVKICCFDPWNSLSHKRESQYNIDDYIKSQLAKINRFTSKNDLLMLIGVHPPTPEKNSSKVYNAPSMFDVEGGAAWSKKLYEILCVHRTTDDPQDTTTEVHVQKVKFQKITGLPTPRSMPAKLNFQRHSNRFTDPDGHDPLEQAKKDKEIQFELEF